MSGPKSFAIKDGILTKYIGTGDSVVIPGGVKSIGENAFLGRGSLKSVTIPGSVTSIGNGAFAGCVSLTGMTLPDGVTSIGIRAFSGCKTLRSVRFGQGLVRIGEGAFERCFTLGEVILTDTKLTGIPESAFKECYGIKQVSFPLSLETIGKEAFCNCRGLEVLDCPANVKRLGEAAFAGIRKVIMPENLRDLAGPAVAPVFWDSPVKSPYKGEPYANLLLIRSGNGKVTEVIPVCSDGSDAYNRNVVLEWKNNGIDQRIQDGYFGKIHRQEVRLFLLKTRLMHPQGLLDEDKAAFLSYLKNKLNDPGEYYIRETVLNDPDLLWLAVHYGLIKKSQCDEFLEIFQETGDAEKVMMMMEYIEKNFGTGFDNYEKRTDARAREQIRVEQRAERNKEKAERKKLERDAILRDPNADLKDLWLVHEYPDHCELVNYKGKAEDLVIPESYHGLRITKISKTQRKGYDTVKSIVLPDSVTEISTGAFSNCKNLERIHLGANLRKTGNYPFSGCGKLKEIVLPKGINLTTRWMFGDCRNLERVIFLNKVKIWYEPSCNFLRGSGKAKIYVYEKTELVDFMLSKDRIVRVSDPDSLVSSNGEIQLCQVPRDDLKPDALKDMVVVHTGFSPEDEDLIQTITGYTGGTIKSSVVLKTDILVYNPDYDHETTKLKRAKELNASGKNIKIMTLEEFLSLVKAEN